MKSIENPASLKPVRQNSLRSLYSVWRWNTGAATRGTLGPRLRSPVHLWDARARAQRNETPWTLKVVHLMGLECLGACRSNVEFCRFFCQAWAPNAEYSWKQLTTFWETGEHFKQHRIERYLSCSPVRSIFFAFAIRTTFLKMIANS